MYTFQEEREAHLKSNLALFFGLVLLLQLLSKPEDIHELLIISAPPLARSQPVVIDGLMQQTQYYVHTVCNGFWHS